MHSATGKISLRRIQFKMAEHNPSMAMFLGKVYLGQREVQEIVSTANADDTIRRMDEYFKSAGIKPDKIQAD